MAVSGSKTGEKSAQFGRAHAPVTVEVNLLRLDMTQYYIIITRIFDESATLRP